MSHTKFTTAPPAPASAEPVAWMHDQPGRVDVIHASVKDLWLKTSRAQNTQFMRELVPCKVEHYTTPLYAAPPAAPAQTEGSKPIDYGTVRATVETKCYVPAAPVVAPPASAVDALREVRDWLADERMTNWSYMEGSDFYSDRALMLTKLSAVLQSLPAGGEG